MQVRNSAKNRAIIPLSVPAGSPEQALVDKLHEEYNVWVLFGEKAYDRAQFFGDSYSIHPAEESINLLKVMLSTSYTLEALEVLESELSRYPKGFFSQFSKSLVINLVGPLHDMRSDVEYTGSGLDSTGFDPEWFYREYSVKSEWEDRATVFEAYCLESPEWWEDHPHIKKKFALMRLLLDAGFGWVIRME